MHNGLRMFLDVRSGSVGGAIARYNKETKQSEAIFSARFNLPILQSFKDERLLSSMFEEIGKMLERMRKCAPGAPEEFHVTICSPWFFSETRTVRHSAGYHSVCDKKWFEKILSTESSLFLNQPFFEKKTRILERTLLNSS